MNTSAPPAAVADVFATCDDHVRTALLELRALILETADATEGVGMIEETLKWGQPSYLTSESGSGSTIRIAATAKSQDHDHAMYFICNTNLVQTFEAMFGDVFDYEGNRAILFNSVAGVPEDELRQCITMALTYHSTKASTR